METIVHNKGIALPITKSGSGQQIIFFNGGGATQISWRKVIQQLRGHYETVTFDFRGHGKASASEDYSFDAFLGDAETVMDAVVSSKPILVAWSLGADLAVAYAAKYPGTIRGIVIVDGAVPITAPLVEDEAKMRQALKSLPVRISLFLMKFTPYRYAIAGDAYADIVVELDTLRPTLLDVYKKLDCAVTMIMATKSAGEKGAHAERNNKIWREGVERVRVVRPDISIHWIDGTHQLPFKHSTELSRIIDEFANKISN
jgi:pimeloyl-ACP methyl ester carboxylesterase